MAAITYRETPYSYGDAIRGYSELLTDGHADTDLRTLYGPGAAHLVARLLRAAAWDACVARAVEILHNV